MAASLTGYHVLVTRPAQNNDTQVWKVNSAGPGWVRIQQKSSVHFVDAHENATNDFSVVTRSAPGCFAGRSP